PTTSDMAASGPPLPSSLSVPTPGRVPPPFPTRRSSDLSEPAFIGLCLQTSLVQKPIDDAPIRHCLGGGRPNDGWERRRSVSGRADRKSTRLNSSHVSNSYAGFCLEKK